MKCPKCGYEQDNTVECESCGIFFKKYEKFLINTKPLNDLKKAQELYNDKKIGKALQILKNTINTPKINKDARTQAIELYLRIQLDKAHDLYENEVYGEAQTVFIAIEKLIKQAGINNNDFDVTLYLEKIETVIRNKKKNGIKLYTENKFSEAQKTFNELLKDYKSLEKHHKTEIEKYLKEVELEIVTEPKANTANLQGQDDNILSNSQQTSLRLLHQ